MFRVIILYLFMLRCATADKICEANAIQKIDPTTRRVVGCEDCVWCKIGFGPSVTCGGSVTGNTPIRCVKCLPGTSFSSEYSSNGCTDCSKCGPHRIVARECTGISDRICGDCEAGFYFDSTTSMCQRCSYCCSDGQNLPMKKCIADGMPTSQQCSYGRSDCTPITAQTTMINTNETVPTTYTMINLTIAIIKNNKGTAKLGTARSKEKHDSVYSMAISPWLPIVLAVLTPMGFILVIVMRRKHHAAKKPQQNERLAYPVQDTQTADPQDTSV